MNISASVAWQRDTDADGIAWLTLDKPGSSTNVLSRDILVELDGHLQAFASQPPRGVVIRSGTPQWAGQLNESALSDEVPTVTKRLWRVLAEGAR